MISLFQKLNFTAAEFYEYMHDVLEPVYSDVVNCIECFFS